MKRYLLFLSVIGMILQANAQFSNAPVTALADTVGIYITSPQGRMTHIEPIHFYQVKENTGMFKNALTGGIAKIKNKNLYEGNASPNKLNPGDCLRVYFRPALDSPYYMFDPMYTLRNFIVTRFDVKKNRRELTTFSVSDVHAPEYGVKETDALKFDVRLIAPNTYEIEILDGSEPGEYCFVFINGTQGVFDRVFDFSVIR